MRFVGRTLLGVTLIALTLGLLALGAGVLRAALEERAGREDGGRPPSERVFAARVAEVVPGEVVPVLTAFGELRAARSLELRAPASGRVTELAPSMVEGGAVRAGDVLLRIDPAEAEAALARARADRSAAEADIRDAARSLDLARDELAAAEDQALLRERAAARAEDLAGRGIGTEAGAEEAELALSAARQGALVRRAAVASAEARLDGARVAAERAAIDLSEAERLRGDLDVRAAFDGVLAEVSATAGGLVTANEKLAELIDPAALEVSFRVSAAQYARLPSEGARVDVSLDVAGIDLSAAGRIVREGAAVEDGRTGRLLFAALEGAAGLRPGDFVTVRVTEPAMAGVALLPAGAVAADGTVLVVGEGDRLESAPAEVLRRQGDDVIVAAGPLAGREVVLERSPLLGAGIKVEPIRPAAEGEAPAAAPETVRLDEARRARLIAFVEGGRMPEEAKARVLAQLREPEVPSATVARIEGRMGG